MKIPTKHKKIETDVLNIYRKVSPSHRNLNTSKNKKDFFLQRINLFKTLGLPLSSFNNKKILEIGGGTGEKSFFYAFYGANVTLLEPNEKSCQVANDIFTKAKLDDRLKIINKSFFDFEPSHIQDYDIVCAEGVLHHTYDPIKSLELIVKNMKQNQIILIAIGESHGLFKRELQKYLAIQLGGSDHTKIENIVKKYFYEHLTRATNFDLRSEKSIIYDNFINPQDKSSDLRDICNVFYKNKISYLSSYPKLDLFYITTPWGHKREDPFNYEYYKSYYHLLEKIWKTCGEENLIHDLIDFDIQKLKNRVHADEKKLTILKNKIAKKSFTKKDLYLIQRGYMGVGLHYFLGIKENNDSSKFDKLLKNYSKVEII